ncbi:MAG: cyclic nucleotide-binding domain-containing protein [Gammaproteobacteria bacterium]|jgi:CRP-like cAMP-binding protein/thioredoxin reductase/Fe-S-cluster-containing hydrogenase component 2
MSTQTYRIAIIGSGPGGLSAATHAAELGVSHVLIESEAHISNTIYRYQKGKHVMDEPRILPLRSPLDFVAGKREAVLESWESGIQTHSANLQLNAEVVGISGSKGNFEIQLKQGAPVKAETVVLGIGVQGNPRTLGVPGEDLPVVQYTLDDPDEYEGEHIIVIGGGDAGIENAIALCKHNTVYIVNRNPEFTRAKDANNQAILEKIEKQEIECFYSSNPARLEMLEGQDQRAVLTLDTLDGEAQVPCDRIIARLGAIPPRRFIESCGIEFPSEDREAIPELSGEYETNVPGIYIIGALGGYPLIKQCMNQGYEVVEYIQGNKIYPADEQLLQAKFDLLEGQPRVSVAIRGIQKRVPLLSGLTTLQLREFFLDSEIRTPKAGEYIFQKDDYTNSFYCIIGGRVHIEINENDPSQVVSLGPGQFFGEMSLLSGRRRSATIRAGKNCSLIETPRRLMNKMINSVASVKRIIDEAFIVRTLQTRFATTSRIEDLQKVAASAELKQFKSGEEIFHEGDEADSLHVIRRGSVTISRMIGGNETTLSYLPAGNYIGEMGLMGQSQRTATVRAAVATETIQLSAENFQFLLDQDQKLKERISLEYKKRLSRNMAMQHRGRGNIISFLISQGLGEATDVLLIDESLCIRCDNCEKACAETHGGTSRLDRKAGPTYASIHVPTSCRHCEHPHCMKDCPPDAIKRAPDGEVFVADNCIGCGNCQRNCPYGVIQMATTPPRKPGLISWLFFGLGPGPGQIPAQRIKKKDPDAIKKAVKCDMCKDLKGGAACVRACPTGAAIRIKPDQLPLYAGQN